MGRRPGCSPPAPPVFRASPVLPPCSPTPLFELRSTAPWPIPSSRRTKARPWPSSASPGLGQDQVTLLLDTYDTEAAAKKVVLLAPRLARDGIAVRGVRLDSGDLADHARRVRAILDHGGLTAGADFRQRRSGRMAASRARGRRPRSTATASAPASPPRATLRRSTVPTKQQVYAGVPKRKRSEGKAIFARPQGLRSARIRSARR